MSKPSALQRAYRTLDRLPEGLKNRGFTLLFGRAVKFFGTAGLRFQYISPRRSVVVIRNRRKVQNHIGGVHAVAMALIGESATGALVGLNLGADSVPVIKRMEVDYVRRASGDLRAEATLSAEQIEQMRGQPKGEVEVALTITDATGEVPVQARMLWAWTPRRR